MQERWPLCGGRPSPGRQVAQLSMNGLLRASREAIPFQCWTSRWSDCRIAVLLHTTSRLITLRIQTTVARY